ncbi:DUF4198 domain-containing protein [Ornithinibacillus sp. L9]|uniref:DUF4198 domain-containing protein n=1 Tax=Ornithinibacillus caprae TaxID=2678566 RepID=A0A6N8FGD4_9BACI|nr:DUF4198 domain-containing protein [Ornithinibacillus caprae]MUK88543.1 DUF4198 domain-containing protein [Ornithinibacillus caprae]
MRKSFVIFLIVVCSLFIYLPQVSAHELFIQVDEFEDSGELRVDILWGHIRDYVSESSPTDYQLFVRYPDGAVEQLNLEEAGVYSRAYVPIKKEGTYTFWALREKSTYTPEDEDVTQLSNHMAKIVHHVGNENTNTEEAVNMEFEIVPSTDISDFSTGSFSGNILLDNSAVSEATVIAYGPKHEILETTTDEKGSFQFELESEGKWLIRANLIEEESGSINGEDYDVISNTSTFLLDTSSDENEQPQTSNWSLVAMLVIGLLIGSAITLVFLRKKLN